MNGADARASQHCNRGFRDERQINRDAVSFAHTECLEDVAEFLDFAVQLSVGEGATVSGLAFPDQCFSVCALGGYMSIDAVRGDVELAVDKPLGAWRLPLQHFFPRLDPVEMTRLLGPERFRISTSFVVNVEGRNVGAARELRRGFELPVFL